MKELPITLTKIQAKQLLRYVFLAEEHKVEMGPKKPFWKRHEVIINKLQGIIYQFEPLDPRGRRPK